MMGTLGNCCNHYHFDYFHVINQLSFFLLHVVLGNIGALGEALFALITFGKRFFFFFVPHSSTRIYAHIFI